MYEDMEPMALEMGLTLDYYWNLTPIEFKKHCEAYEKKQENDMLKQDVLNHILGQYIAIAVNDPKHYPKKPYLTKHFKINKSNNQSNKITKQEDIKALFDMIGGKNNQ